MTTELELASEETVLLDMADRLESYEASGERPLPAAPRRCATCPFRGADRAYQEEGALVPAQDWPCHTYDYEHCAGHAAAQRRFGKPTPEAIRARSIQGKE